ncbi:MAG TPA: phosphoglycerate kinase [Nocardioidaceae bacterium]|nr:phosphoglycerate kinase [Nocardioidaceae bacterium]
MPSVDDLAERVGGLQGKRVLLRSDLNVPLDGLTITDDSRVRASVPTIDDLRRRGAKVIVISHLGRPGGHADPAYSLAPVATHLAELMDASVTCASDTVGQSAHEAVDDMTDGDVVMLANVRFNPGETSKDDAERGAFADQLADLGDVFVSDGFGVVHRKQASVYDVAQRLPHAAGGLVLAEVAALRQLVEAPQHPFVVVLGGAKVSDKLGVIEALLGRADTLLVGGGMVFTFLAAQGHRVGRSLLEADQVEAVRGYLRADGGAEVVLPSDVVVTRDLSAEAHSRVVPADGMQDDWIGADIGPDSAHAFAKAISEARTVFWNGPMGVFEIEQFAKGTRAVAKALTEVQGLSVVGGGDSAAAVHSFGYEDDAFGHVSTGGGASLEYLEGRRLPGLEVLES